MNITIIYFSPTGNTAKISLAINKELQKLGNKVDMLDITNSEDRQKISDFNYNDALFFGFPIYYGRAPRLIREWFSQFDGKGIKCSLFFTYGGVQVGAAHYDMINILQSRNFKVISSAEFLGRHTYSLAGWDLMKDHPNKQDIVVAREFAQKTHEKLIESNIKQLKFAVPKKSEEELDKLEFMSKRAIITPARKLNDCSMCRTCEQVCPTNAMDAELGKPKPNLCIRCLRCVVNCPDNVIKIEDMSYQFKRIKKLRHLTDDKLKSRQSRYFL